MYIYRFAYIDCKLARLFLLLALLETMHSSAVFSPIYVRRKKEDCSGSETAFFQLREKVICPIKDGLINRYTRFRLGLYGNSESVSDRVAASIQAGERKRREIEGASGGDEDEWKGGEDGC